MLIKDPPLIAGTAGGIIASTLPNISTHQFLSTCILALVGATVSFFTTLLLRKLINLLKTYNWKVFFTFWEKK